MPDQEDRQEIRASILDRLIDREPWLPREPVQRRFATFSQIRESVIRDLENLLNTRRNVLRVPVLDPVASGEIPGYGVRDFIAENPRSPSVRQQIRLEIERALALFEPRLKNVTVRLETLPGDERNLRFRITALLSVDPVRAPITFDTCLDINSGAFSIRK